MATQVPPKKNTAFSMEVSLTSQADVKLIQDNATLAAGDVVVLKNGVLDGNIDTLPTAVVGATRVLLLSLSADEMNADRTTVIFHDAAGAEWCDLTVDIHTVTSKQIDDIPAAAPAVADIRTEMDANSTKLANLDATVSSRSTYAGGAVASVTNPVTVGTNSDKTGYALTTGERTTLYAGIWSYATRTLSSLSALLSSIWTYVTRTLTSTAAQTTAAVSGSTLNPTVACDYNATLTGLAIPADWLKIWLTFKADPEQADTTSTVQIVVSNPGVAADGLLYLGGAAPASPVTDASASLTIDQAAGTAAIWIDDAAMAVLSRASSLSYDVKCLATASGVTILTSGTANIGLPVTRARS
jgi:hypothetical protein